MTEEPSVKITLSQVYDEVTSLRELVAALARDLPSHVTVTKGKQEEYDARLANHGNRLYEREKEAIELRGELNAVRAEQQTARDSRPVRAPWYSVAGGIASVIGGAGSLLVLLAILSKLSTI